MFKSIFFPTISYPTPTLTSSIATAVALAKKWDARLFAYHSEVSAPVGVGYARAMPFLGTMIDAERAKTETNSSAILADLENEAGKAGIAIDINRYRFEFFDPSAWAAAARYADLSLVFVEEESATDVWAVEAVVFESGRPCLTLPVRAKTQLERFDHVMVAWDGGRAAARAVADALPILRSAARVSIIVATPDKQSKDAQPERLVKYFELHGIRATQKLLTGTTAADAIANAASVESADLLVMGAYGHSQLRNFVLGSVTERLLRNPPVPLFLSH